MDTWVDPSRRSVTYASLLRSFSDSALRFDDEGLEICNTLYDNIYAPGESRDYEYYGIQMLHWVQIVSERLNTPVISFICDGDGTKSFNQFASLLIMYKVILSSLERV